MLVQDCYIRFERRNLFLRFPILDHVQRVGQKYLGILVRGPGGASPIDTHYGFRCYKADFVSKCFQIGQQQESLCLPSATTTANERTSRRNMDMTGGLSVRKDGKRDY